MAKGYVNGAANGDGAKLLVHGPAHLDGKDSTVLLLQEEKDVPDVDLALTVENGRDNHEGASVGSNEEEQKLGRLAHVTPCVEEEAGGAQEGIENRGELPPRWG